jgi:hypothetical protein
MLVIHYVVINRTLLSKLTNNLRHLRVEFPIRDRTPGHHQHQCDLYRTLIPVVQSLKPCIPCNTSSSSSSSSSSQLLLPHNPFTISPSSTTSASSIGVVAVESGKGGVLETMNGLPCSQWLIMATSALLEH